LCQEAGILGDFPGLIGPLRATEIIKQVLGKGNPLAGHLLWYDTLKAEFREYQIKKISIVLCVVKILQ